MRRVEGSLYRVSRGGVRAGLCAALTLILTLILAGCLPNEKPGIGLDVPKAYERAPRKPDTALPAPDWWRGFRSAQLTDLMEEALTSNLDIAAAVARIIQADANARIAGAALLPTVDLDASASRSRPPGGPDRSTYTTQLSASWELDFWGRNRSALRAAENLAVASRFDREVVALSTVASVATAYFNVLAAADRLRVARGNLAAASRVLRLINERLEAGVASALDVAQQESLTNTVRAAIPPLEQTLQQNIATLAALVGRPPERVKVAAGSMWTLGIPRVTPGLPSDLIGQRPDIREAEAQLASANANVDSARAAFFPTITLTGNTGYQSNDLRNLLRPDSWFYNLVGGLTQPIFDGRRLEGQLDLRRGQQDEALQLYRRSVVNGFADVDRALIAIAQTTRREVLQREVVKSSRRAFEISETRLREGAVDLVTVLNTQQTLFQAEDVLAQARLARLLAVLSLFQALGGGWQLPPEPVPPNVTPASVVVPAVR